jgi:hypothetical protein
MAEAITNNVLSVEKRRPRRVASDEAHAWARNLRLGDPYAKLVLSTLTLYVQGDGVCFVGIETLADDTELSADTVRRRLAWLERVGVIARTPQWIDSDGRRNSEGRGKRTTDQIRLLLYADVDQIEQVARDKGGLPSPSSQQGQRSSSSAISLSGEQEQNPDQPTVGSALGLDQTSHCGEGLISEPEPKDSPLIVPPKGDDENEFDQQRAGAERMRAIQLIWPEPITDGQSAINVLSVLSEADWQDCLVGARNYTAFIRGQSETGRTRHIADFHRWARNRKWIGYLNSGQKFDKTAKRKVVRVDSVEGHAWTTLCQIAQVRPVEFSGCLSVPEDMPPQLLALAKAPDKREWKFIDSTMTNHIEAWKALLDQEFGARARPQLLNDRDWRGRTNQKMMGFLAPWLWPPKVDGSIYAESTNGLNEEA